MNSTKYKSMINLSPFRNDFEISSTKTDNKIKIDGIAK